MFAFLDARASLSLLYARLPKIYKQLLSKSLFSFLLRTRTSEKTKKTSAPAAATATALACDSSPSTSICFYDSIPIISRAGRRRVPSPAAAAPAGLAASTTGSSEVAPISAAVPRRGGSKNWWARTMPSTIPQHTCTLCAPAGINSPWMGDPKWNRKTF